MKITYSKEIGNCDFVLEVFETTKVVRTSGEFVGKNADGELVHISIEKVVKIED